jgi:dihydrofolate reductase
VVTHSPPREPVPDVTFADNLADGLAAARAAAGERYVNVLGADIARQCLQAGELDEVLAVIAPVLLGDGVRLFAHPGGQQVQLERLNLTEVPHGVNLWLRVVR